MRMLQGGRPAGRRAQYRSRVVGFDPVDIEALYIKRIPLEGLAVSDDACAIGEDEVAACVRSSPSWKVNKRIRIFMSGSASTACFIAILPQVLGRWTA